MATGKSNLYFGGVPTGPDIVRIREAFPNPAEGDIIEYSKISTVLGCPKSSGRFKTVTNRWRKLHEAETRQVIGVEPGVGFVVLSPVQTLDTGVGKLRHAARAVRRGGDLAGKADKSRLSTEDRTRADHAVRASATILGAMRTAARPLESHVQAALEK